MYSCRPVRLSMAFVVAALTFSACMPNRPAPTTAPAPVWQPEPDDLGEAPEIVDLKVTAPKRDILGGVAYDLPVEANSWVEAELDFLVGERREVIQRWIERGDFYHQFITGTLSAEGVPTDLYHLAMIESGFLPTARSRVGAVGMWQFMPATGRALGLRIDAEVDERMDPIRSTRAAARHLRDLKRSMGDWALAAAAYNAGPGRINRGLRAYSAGNFWELAERGDLAEETKHYVPRLYAMTVIARGRQRYGFPVAASDVFAFDSIQVEYATPLQELARMGDVSINQLSSMNPHLVKGVAPAGGYWVWVPAARGPALQRAYLASDFRKERGYGSYVVRSGDYLGRIAERSGLKASRVRELNPGVEFEPLQIGVKLQLPYAAAEKLASRAEEPRSQQSETRTAAVSRPPTSSGGDSRKAASTSAAGTHEVRPGETLWQIARDNDVTVEALQKANNLDGETIRPGMALRLPASGATGPAVAIVDEHVVRGGETLWGIARKYGSSVEAIQQANKLGERAIRPGQRLAIPK